MTKHLDGETKMDRWCDFDYGYIPAGPLADFWREHDKRQQARREILKDRNSGNQKQKGERSP